MIKAVTFDFWETLYHGAPVDYRARRRILREMIQAAGHTPCDPNRFDEAVAVAADHWRHAWEAEYRTVGATEWLNVIFTTLDITIPADHFARIETHIAESILRHPPTLATEAYDVLAELSKTYRLAIISDTGLTPGRIMRQTLRDDGIFDFFTHFTFSDELGASKPHAKAFLSTLNALDAEPDEAAHVGDIPRTDIAGALDVGMRAVQYTGFVTNLSQLTPSATISSHRELLPLLERW